MIKLEQFSELITNTMNKYIKVHLTNENTKKK